MNENPPKPPFAFLGGVANQISFSRILLIPLILFGFGSLTVRIIILLVIFVLDILDGFVARRLNQTSTLGGFVDIFVDRIVEMILWVYFTISANVLPIDRKSVV